MKAAVERAKLDLDYTKVIAPIGGRTSRYNVTVGNLIQPGNQLGGTLLTTIVSMDPMYAYYDVDEHTALRVRQMIREGRAESVREGKFRFPWASQTKKDSRIRARLISWIIR